MLSLVRPRIVQAAPAPDPDAPMQVRTRAGTLHDFDRVVWWMDKSLLIPIRRECLARRHQVAALRRAEWSRSGKWFHPDHAEPDEAEVAQWIWRAYCDAHFLKHAEHFEPLEPFRLGRYD